jgi:glycosyltransferase involved in cell wall biosynthesis
MKVLIIPEFGEVGSGTFSFLIRLLEIHKKNKINTAVLLSPSQSDEVALSIIQQYTDNIFYSKFLRPKKFYKPILSPFFDMLYCFKSVKKFKPDIIHISNGTPGIMFGVFLIKKSVVLTMHTYPMRYVHRYVSFFWKILLCGNKIVNTVSRYSALQIEQKFQIKQKKINIIYNSAKNVDHIHKYYNNTNVVTVGHVIWYKNPETWLSVAEKVITKLPNVKFYWLGNGELLDKYREKVKALRLEENIIFKGCQKNVSEYCENAALYFHPSRIENHSIAVVDAMSHGLPCVTSDAGGLPESVVNNVTGYTCSVDDVDGFAEIIINLLSDKLLREKMGTAGKKRAEELFCQEKQENEYLKLYNSIL